MITNTLSAPLDIEFDINSVCQLDCSYCSAKPFSGLHVDGQRAMELVSEMGRLGVFSLYLSGGEPTLHPDFFKIIHVATQAIPRVTVNTNGIKLSKYKYAQRLFNLAPGLHVVISIDSTNDAINSINRGRSARHAKQAVLNCYELGQPLSISCVVTNENSTSADRLVGHYYPKVKNFRFFPVVPKDKESLAILTDGYWDRFQHLSERLRKQSSLLPDLKIIAPGRGSASDSVNPCNCAHLKMYIDSRLNAYPCYYSACEANKLGNLMNSSLEAIWCTPQSSLIRGRSKATSLCGMGTVETAIPTRYSSRF